MGRATAEVQRVHQQPGAPQVVGVQAEPPGGVYTPSVLFLRRRQAADRLLGPARQRPALAARPAAVDLGVDLHLGSSDRLREQFAEGGRAVTAGRIPRGPSPPVTPGGAPPPPPPPPPPTPQAPPA